MVNLCSEMFEYIIFTYTSCSFKLLVHELFAESRTYLLQHIDTFYTTYYILDLDALNFRWSLPVLFCIHLYYRDAGVPEDSWHIHLSGG